MSFLRLIHDFYIFVLRKYLVKVKFPISYLNEANHKQRIHKQAMMQLFSRDVKEFEGQHLLFMTFSGRDGVRVIEN